MIRAIKRWLAVKIVMLCDLALTYKDYADDQSEINEVIATRNKFKRELNKPHRELQQFKDY